MPVVCLLLQLKTGGVSLLLFCFVPATLILMYSPSLATTQPSSHLFFAFLLCLMSSFKFGCLLPGFCGCAGAGAAGLLAVVAFCAFGAGALWGQLQMGHGAGMQSSQHRQKGNPRTARRILDT